MPLFLLSRMSFVHIVVYVLQSHYANLILTLEPKILLQKRD